MKKILVVEDEYYARKSIVKILQESDLDIQVCGEAANGMKAIELLEEYKDIALVITDIQMQKMGGLELASYLHKHISLRELAENKYFVNYSYCSRLFSQETGMNFSKYLIQYRLKKAKTLLENKDMKISFIAFEVGYNDVSHFIQSFKKSYGLTPEEYRARKKIE